MSVYFSILWHIRNCMQPRNFHTIALNKITLALEIVVYRLHSSSANDVRFTQWWFSVSVSQVRSQLTSLVSAVRRGKRDPHPGRDSSPAQRQLERLWNWHTQHNWGHSALPAIFGHYPCGYCIFFFFFFFFAFVTFLFQTIYYGLAPETVYRYTRMQYPYMKAMDTLDRLYFSNNISGYRWL